MIKCFSDTHSFTFEKNAFKIANNLRVPIPQYIFDCECADSCLIGMSYSVSSILDSAKKGYSPYSAGYKVGQILKHLHTLKSDRMSQKDIYNHRKLTSDMFSRFLRDPVEKSLPLMEDYVEDAGVFGYCYGDASINNFTILDDKVIMIDFSGLAKKGSLGIPAYEYYQFLTSIRYNLQDGFHPGIYKEILRDVIEELS